MSLDNTTAAIAGAILGPVAGVIGSRIKQWVDTRDAQGKSKRLMKEAGDLLEFADKVQRSADAGGVVTKLPSSCLQSLQGAVVHKVEEVAFSVSPAGVAAARAEQRASRTILGRIFLSVRPCSWGVWLLHYVYYTFFGITVICGITAGYDYHLREPDWDGGFVLTGFLALITVLLNVFANAVDHPRPKTAATANVAATQPQEKSKITAA